MMWKQTDEREGRGIQKGGNTKENGICVPWKQMRREKLFVREEVQPEGRRDGADKNKVNDTCG